MCSSWAFGPDAQIWSGVVATLLPPVFIFAWMVANSVAASMLSERWTNLEDGFVGHWLIGASTVATGFQEMASALCATCLGNIGC